MPDQIVSKPVGRPTVVTEEIVGKLVEVFRLGVSDTAACAHAGISRDTFYERLKSDPLFSDKITSAKNFAVLASRQNVVKAIVQDKDLDTSKWYIEKHDIQEPVQNNTQVNIFTSLRDKYTKRNGVDAVVVTNGHTNGHTNGVLNDKEPDA